MDGPLEWFGALGTIVAAALIASDTGRRITGWAFVLFVAVSLAWIAAALLSGNTPIAIQNAALVAVNGWGVYQFLFNRRKKRELQLVEECTRKAREADEAT